MKEETTKGAKEFYLRHFLQYQRLKKHLYQASLVLVCIAYMGGLNMDITNPKSWGFLIFMIWSLEGIAWFSRGIYNWLASPTDIEEEIYDRKKLEAKGRWISRTISIFLWIVAWYGLLQLLPKQPAMVISDEDRLQLFLEGKTDSLFE